MSVSVPKPQEMKLGSSRLVLGVVSGAGFWSLELAASPLPGSAVKSSYELTKKTSSACASGTILGRGNVANRPNKFSFVVQENLLADAALSVAFLQLTSGSVMLPHGLRRGTGHAELSSCTQAVPAWIRLVRVCSIFSKVS